MRRLVCGNPDHVFYNTQQCVGAKPVSGIP